MAGIIPGILLMLAYIATILFLTLRNPALGPAGPKASWKERASSLRGGLFEVLVVFALSIGGLYAGWFTLHRSRSVGASGVLAVSLLGSRLD